VNRGDGGGGSMIYVIAYDFGTTGVKTCLFEIGDKVKLLVGCYASYGLYILENGGAEQDADEWWDAMCRTTKEVFTKTDIRPEQIAGISFCSQMQGLVLVDRDGKALRRPMSYMDQRAGREMKQTQGKGLTISGVNAKIMLRSLIITHAASTSVKDPLWKYKWVEANEPDIFAKVYKWLDVKEYLICRCTGECVMTEDSAYSTFLYDTRPGKEGWNRELCGYYKVNPEHLPKIIRCTDVAGKLTEKAASELGLKAGTEVYGGGGDATLIGIGAGCTEVGSTHIYSGTSGWVGTVTDKQVVDIQTMIAAIVGAQKGRYTYFAEMETAGKCFEWVKNHLALDEIGIYLKKTDVTQKAKAFESETEAGSTEEAGRTDREATFESLYDYLSYTVSKSEPGAGGVLFTPWLHGNRCPFEGPDAGGMFFNIKLETGKTELIRAVLEGICYHLRWMLECEEKKVRTSGVIRFVGGGALSKVVCQMLADIIGRPVETVEETKDVGAVGAAVLVAVGCGRMKDMDAVKSFISVADRYEPDPASKKIYDRNFEVFKKLYDSNKKNFTMLNHSEGNR